MMRRGVLFTLCLYIIIQLAILPTVYTQSSRLLDRVRSTAPPRLRETTVTATDHADQLPSNSTVEQIPTKNTVDTSNETQVVGVDVMPLEHDADILMKDSSQDKPTTVGSQTTETLDNDNSGSYVDMFAVDTAFMGGISNVEYKKDDTDNKSEMDVDDGEMTTVTSEPGMDGTIEVNYGETTVDTPEARGSVKRRYMNRIWVHGHRHDAMSRLPSVLHSALWNGHYFERIEPLTVTILTSHFYEADGEKVTEITYSVSYYGQLIERYTVDQVLTDPDASQSLYDGMADRDMMQYTPSQPHTVTQHSWAKKHLSVIIVTSSLLGLLLLVTVLSIIRRHRYTGKDKRWQGRGPCVTADTTCDKRRLFDAEESPPPYSAHVQFKTNSVMDNNALC